MYSLAVPNFNNFSVYTKSNKFKIMPDIYSLAILSLYPEKDQFQRNIKKEEKIMQTNKNNWLYIEKKEITCSIKLFMYYQFKSL
jgi:hypothetical protein